jgi:hypothetical protein
VLKKDLTGPALLEMDGYGVNQARGAEPKRTVALGLSGVQRDPEEAAQRVVADLFEQLSRGGSVSVHVEELGGKEGPPRRRA